MAKRDERTADRRGLVKLMHQAARSRSLYDVFRDFCEVSALSISNAVDLQHRDEREKRYLDVVKSYKPEEVALFPQMFGCLVEELERGYCDALGQTFMELELSNKNVGQFFTPYSLCQLMAQVTVGDDLKEMVAKQGYVTVSDPASGGGATVIAFAEAMRAAGLNPQTQMHVHAQDLDIRSVHMTYVQLALFNIPAIVTCGDTLRLTETSRWYTPAHILGGWTFKLRRRAGESFEKADAPEATIEPPKPDLTLPPVGEQIQMFKEN